MTTKAGIAELKGSLSAYLEKVKSGEDVIVTDRGRPVARLSRVVDLSDDVDRLVRKGILRAPVAVLDVAGFLAETGPADAERRLLGSLVAERESGW